MGISGKTTGVAGKWHLPAIAAVAVTAHFLLMDFLSPGTFCFFKALFGIPCPGCGLGRAILSIFRGEFALSLSCHPLAMPLLGAGMLYPFRRKLPDFLFRENLFWPAALVIVLLVYAVRMILFFPDVPPMDLNRASLLFRVFGL